MRKGLLFLGLGIAIGYFLGFDDARKNEQDLLHRAVERVRGAVDQRSANDVDAVMNRLEKR
jgi:hypothetical protein